jgi:hypothetical protein
MSSYPDNLEKPELKRDIKLSTEPLPNMENATFTIHNHDTTTEKFIIAYDVAGNAIECSIDEIVNNKYRPKPDFGITEVPPTQAPTPQEEGRTRSGKCFRISPQELTEDMMKTPSSHRRLTLADLHFDN